MKLTEALRLASRPEGWEIRNDETSRERLLAAEGQYQVDRYPEGGETLTRAEALDLVAATLQRLAYEAGYQAAEADWLAATVAPVVA